MRVRLFGRGAAGHAVVRLGRGAIGAMMVHAMTQVAFRNTLAKYQLRLNCHKVLAKAS